MAGLSTQGESPALGSSPFPSGIGGIGLNRPRRLFAAIAILGSLAALSGCNDSSNDNNSKFAPAPPPPVKAGIFSMGQPIDTDAGYTVSVENYDRRQQVGLPNSLEAAPDGDMFVVVNFKEKNTSAAPIPSYAIKSLVLVDGAGVEHDEDSEKTNSYMIERLGGPRLWTQLDPGVSVQDVSVFDVPKNAFDPSQWFLALGDKDGPRVKLTSQGVAAALPTPVPGRQTTRAEAGSGATPSAASEAPLSASSDTQTVGGLLAEYGKANQACRKGGGPDKGAPDCAYRDSLNQALTLRGMCLGKSGEPDSQKTWRKCEGAGASGPG